MTSQARSNAIEVLSEDRCWELIGNRTVGRLATAITNHPDIFPVNYRLQGRTVVVRTAEGQKLASAVLGTSVAFEIDDLDEATHTGWSVVLKGHAEEPQRLEDYLGAEDLNITPWASGEKSRFMIITPTSVTGREIRLAN